MGRFIAKRLGLSLITLLLVSIIVFAISGFMAGVGGVILAGNLNSVAPDQGGGTLLLDAISAAVIRSCRSNTITAIRSAGVRLATRRGADDRSRNS